VTSKTSLVIPEQDVALYFLPAILQNAIFMDDELAVADVFWAADNVRECRRLLAEIRKAIC
jgi:hypothetical protein